MKTQDEIMARLEERKPGDPLGFETGEYFLYLDFVHAKPYLKEKTLEREWPDESRSPLEKMHDYMDFAWGKANDQRGISANRSIQHCIAWLWLASEDDLLEEVEREYDTNYHYYGKPILEMICDHFGWDWELWDNGIRTNGDH